MSLSVIPSFIAAVFSLYSYQKRKYPHFLYMGLSMLALSIGGLLIAYGYLSLNLIVYRIGVIFSGPMLFGLVLLIESISTLKRNLWRWIIVTMVVTAMIIFGLLPNAVTTHQTALDEIAPIIIGNFNLAGSLAFVLAGILWTYYMAKIYVKSPLSVRKYAAINLGGAIIAGPMSAIAFASGLVWIIPGADYFLISVGYLICTYCFIKEPKLGYILPFDVYLLHVYQFERGTPIFTHEFARSLEINDTLLSGILMSLSTVFQEALKRGNIRAVVLGSDTLLIDLNEDHKLAFVLLVSDSNPLLRYGLELFSRRFVDRLGQVLNRLSLDLNEIEIKAVELVETSFPFVAATD